MSTKEDECADLWVFASPLNILYAVHGCVDTGTGPWCYNSKLSQITCSRKLLQPDEIPGCSNSSFLYDNISVSGCISALNVQLDQSGQLDLSAVVQILNRTSSNFPKCLSGSELIACPAQLEYSQLLPGSTNPKVTSKSTAITIPTFQSDQLSTNSFKVLSNEGPVPVKLDDKQQIDGQGQQGASPNRVLIIVLSAVLGFTLVIGIIAFFVYRKRRGKDRKINPIYQRGLRSGRKFEDELEDDGEDMFTKFVNSTKQRPPTYSSGIHTMDTINTAINYKEKEDYYSSPTDEVDPSIFQGKRYVALHPYRKEQIDELSVEVGDMLQVNKYYSDGWCNGTNITTGLSGMFPFALVVNEDEHMF
ncbi:hypothetical protein HK096_003123 [Nowakowskiella sp. JEL0078]|nr:hypothetical protein HK096_003123 [Nowakowskiella sp. JEL0078]